LSYSGIHKPSLLGRLGGLLGTAVVLVGTFLFSFAVFIEIRAPTDILLFYGELTLALAIAVVLHEGGHLLVALALGQPARKIRIGSGSTLFGFRAGSLVIQICTNPIGGGAVYFSGLDSSSRSIRIASLVAGPGMNLLTAGYAFGLLRYSPMVLGAFALANVATFLSSAVPSTSVAGDQEHPSDGMQLFRLILKPPTRSAYFDGDLLTGDAQAALVLAYEDALLAGAPEVTDEHLLRALNQDPVVAALLATVDVSGRLPAGGTPASDEEPAPTWSATALAIIDTAFHKARDMGLSKPNAAGLCLGLLAADCPASHLLKDAGVTEEAIRNLAAGTGDARDSDRSGGIISPDLPLERWGTAADHALAYAYRVAVADHSPIVGTEHIVAALVTDPPSRSARALARLGFILMRQDKKLEYRDVQDANTSPQLSAQVRRAVAGSLLRTGPSYPSGTGELCLGIIDQGAGIGAKLLEEAGVTVAAMERALRLEARDRSEPAGCTAASWPMWHLRASSRMGAGRWVEARDDFIAAERVVATDEQRALCRNNAAWCALMSGEPTLSAQALELARAAIATQPDRPAFIGTYAFALLENGSPVEAAALLEPVAASHTRPRDRASDLSILAMCHTRLDKREAAAADLRAARDADPKCTLLERAQAEFDKADHVTLT
jgi:peptidase M50-like protein/ClpA/ClpB-like protein